METGPTVVANLASLGPGEEGRFGGKSANLGALIGAGIPVPPGFAIATDAFDEFLGAGPGAAIERALADLDPEDVGSLAATAEAIAAAFAASPLRPSLRQAIETAYAALERTSGCERPPVAVRSSARGEDSEEATFAGQQETFLWVRGADAVCDAVRDCWASLYSPAAISYRAHLDAGGEAAMGVAVQLMVDAAVSGVLFTRSPLSGDPSVIVVDASWGLGLGVVGGEVTPDEFVVSKVTGEVLKRTIGGKEVLYSPTPDGGPPQARAVAPELREVACLDENQLRELAALGGRVDAHFGAPQDVEWALSGGESGEFFVLQARPVTTLPSRGADTVPDSGSALSMVMRSFGAGGGKES